MLENIDKIIEFVTMLTTVLFVVCRSNSNLKKKIEEHMTPNGGSSLRDAIDRIENKLATLEATQLAALDLNSEGAGHFLADKSGNVFWVSDRFAEVMDLEREECLGVEWVKGVSNAHEVFVFSNWRLRVNTGESISIDFDTKAGSSVRLKAVPIVDQKEKVLGFVGNVKVLIP